MSAMREDRLSLISEGEVTQASAPAAGIDVEVNVNGVRPRPPEPVVDPAVNFLKESSSQSPSSRELSSEPENGSLNNNLRVIPPPPPRAGKKRVLSLTPAHWHWTKRLSQIWRFHHRVVVSALLTVLSATGAIILFPVYLRSLTTQDLEDDGPQPDGYSACFSLTTTTTFLMGVTGLTLKLIHYKSGRTVFYPMISLAAMLKVGSCNALAALTICYAWEDHKVSCNLQDPLLGLVFLFAVVTHGVGKWKELGFRRSFSLVTIAAGIFISVDYTIVDRYKCRGHFYYDYPLGAGPTPGPTSSSSDSWSWQVHLVWTLAFVVSIWLWTLAMFCMESSLPHLKEKRHHIGEQYNAVKMKVIRVNVNQEENGAGAPAASDPLTTSAAVASEDEECQRAARPRPTIRQLRTIYSRISYLRVYNATLWFHIATWTVIAALFWTQLVPGFRATPVNLSALPHTLVTGLTRSWTGSRFWLLVSTLLVYSQSFAYLLLLIRSPLIALSVSALSLPLVSIWWSVFQYNHNALIWAPMASGELLCALLGIPLIAGGIVYLYKLDVLKLDYKIKRVDGSL